MDVDDDDTSSLSSLGDTEDRAPVSTRDASTTPAPSTSDNVNRRRSGRVSKPIQTIYKDALKETATRKKRKRVAREDSSDEEEEEEEGDDQEERGETAKGKEKEDATEKAAEEVEEGDDGEEEDEEEEDALSSFDEDESTEGEPDEEELKEMRKKQKKAAAVEGKANKTQRGGRGGARAGRRGGGIPKPATKRIKTLDGPVPSKAARTRTVDSSATEDGATHAEARKKAPPKEKKKVPNGKPVVKAAVINGDIFCTCDRDVFGAIVE